MTRTAPLVAPSIRSPRGIRTAALAALAAAALALSACSGAAVDTADSATADTPVTGGTATVATGAEMSGFDPVRVQGIGAGLEKVAQVLDTLLTYDEVTGEITPRLAQSMETTDGQTWVMTLRDGVTFTDGTPLDAEAVIFNLDRHLAADSTSAAKSQLSAITSMTATGTYEVTFELAAPSGSFPIVFTWASPAGLIGSPTALADPDAFNSNPVGAGPFKVESWTPDDQLVLVRNDDYWDTGKPYLDELVYTVLPDLQTRADQLVSGGVVSAVVPSSRWASIAQTPTVDLEPVATIGQALVPNASTGPGSDERVRTAIAMALDGEVTAQVLFGGTEFWDGDTTCIPWAAGSPICVEGSVYPQDVAAASALVAEYVADGGDVSTDLVYHQGLADQAAYVQQQLEAIGLDVELRPVDIAEYFAAEATGDYGIFLGSGGYPILWSRLYSGGTNWGRVAYPELDELLLAARDDLELSDRNEAWRQVVEFVHDNAILQWISPYTSGVGYSTSLHFGTDGEYPASLMVYFDDAWLSS